MSQEEDRVREKIAEVQYALWCKSLSIPEPPVAFVDLDEEEREHWLQEADQILSIKGLLIKDDDQSLPEIPEFQYDKEEYRPYLKRGAINYSKMLKDNWVKVIGESK